MSSPVIAREQLPQEQATKLLPGEIAHHFGYIDAKGGCADTSRAKQWILITNRRILFEAAVKERNGVQERFMHQVGSIPISKVSYVGTLTSQTLEGCSQKKTTSLRINSSGGEIVLAIPTKEEVARIQGVIDEIISQK